MQFYDLVRFISIDSMFVPNLEPIGSSSQIKDTKYHFFSKWQNTHALTHLRILPHLIFQRLRLGRSDKHLAMLVNLRSWRISHISSYTFLLALSTLVASLGLSLGSRIVGPREPKVQMGELNTNCNSSVFLKGVMKMADVDINPFGDHNKTDAQPDESGETIPLIPGGVRGGATWESECKRETLFGGKLKELDSRKHRFKGCIESYLKAYAKSQKHSISAISNSEMGNCTRKAKSMSLTIRGGELRLVGAIIDILGKVRLRELGFGVPGGELMA